MENFYFCRIILSPLFKVMNHYVSLKQNSMKKTTFIIFAILLSISSFAQQLTLTFTGREQSSNTYIQLSRIEITDNTRGWTETLTFPDTIAVLTSNIGVEDYTSGKFQLSQNNPNPFNGSTDVNLTLAEMGTVSMTVTDMNGRVVVSSQRFEPQQIGINKFHVNLMESGIYILYANQNGKTSSVKMINMGNGMSNSIENAGIISQSFQPKGNGKGNISHPFAAGDAMTYKGYAIVDGVEIEGQPIEQAQNSSETITLSIQTTGLACVDAPTVTDYDGNTYNTVQIGNQCWMRENLKTMHYADGSAIPHLDNSSMIDPSYDYPDNLSNNFYTYGLVYNWPAVMGGSASSNGNPSGVQGICPTGWHVPSDAEWQTLELYIGVPASDIDNMNTYRGTVAAKLAGGGYASWTSSTVEGAAGNFSDPNHNSTGFSALPAGGVEGMAAGFNDSACFWTSTLETTYNAILRTLYYSQSGIRRHHLEKAWGASVRCIKD